jgi:hypothetical protein
MSNKPCILLASSPEAKIPLSNALADTYTLLPCHTQTQAISILNERSSDIALILCTLRFDDSRMYDFLQYVKSNEQARAKPFVCLTVTRSALGVQDKQFINEALEKLVKGFGGTAFIDYYGWCREYGMEQGNQNLLAYIEKVLSNKKQA